MMSTPLPDLPVIEKVTDVPRADLDARVVEHALPLPNLLIGAYELPRGALFLEYPKPMLGQSVRNFPMPGPPRAYPIRLPDGTRTSLVLARELGDLEYPVTLRHHRQMVRADAKRVSQRGFTDVMAWLNLTPAWSPTRRLA